MFPTRKIQRGKCNKENPTNEFQQKMTRDKKHMVQNLNNSMPSEMALHPGFSFLLEVATNHWTHIVAMLTVQIEMVSVYKFYPTDVACVRPAMHSVNMQHKLGHSMNSSNPTVWTSQSFLCRWYWHSSTPSIHSCRVHQ